MAVAVTHTSPMSNDWNDYPFSAFSAAFNSVLGTAIGFVLAIVAGFVIGFIGQGVPLVDFFTEGWNSWFLVFFVLYPILFLAQLGTLSGLLMALILLVLSILYFKVDSFKLEILMLCVLLLGMYTFQSFGSDNPNASWFRLFMACGAVVVFYVCVRAAPGCWWLITKRGRK